MKRKILFVLAIVFMLTVLSCLFSITAIAQENAEEPIVTIGKFNLVFEDNVYLKYAVKFDGIDDGNISADKIGMLYFTEPQSDYTGGSESYSSNVVGYTTIDGEKYYTFEYRYITAKQMTDYIYSIAYIEIDGVRYYSAPVKYSVLEYAYAKLGKTGEMSDDENFKNLLSATLEQGAMAQKYFGYKTDRLANDEYYQVCVVGGALEDGFTSGLYLATETAILTAPITNENLTFVGWYNSTGESVSTDNPVSLTGFINNDTYTALYGTVEKGELAYTSNGDGTGYVSGIGTCTDSDIIIPSMSPNGDIVKGIGESAFRNCGGISSVTLPEGVETIGYEAFAYCFDLQNIVLPNTIKSIGYNALMGTSIAFAEYENAFYAGNEDNPYLALISAKDTSIDYCTINSSTMVIADYAFCNCTLLEAISIPDNVKYSGTEMFSGCTSLSEVHIGCEYLGAYSFLGCSALKTVTMSDNVVDMGIWTFHSCSSLESITIGKNVTVIGEVMFSGCDSLVSVVIPDNVVSIESSAFACNGLKTIVLGSGLKTIAEGAFSYNIVFDAIYYKGSQNDWNEISLAGNFAIQDGVIYYYSETEPTVEGNFWHYVDDVPTPWPAYTVPEEPETPTYSEGLLFTSNGDGTCYVNGKGTCTDIILSIPPISPNGDIVTAIGGGAFRYNTNIISIEIPESITSIGDLAFLGCYRLIEVINHSALDIVSGSSANGYIANQAKNVHNGESRITNINDYLFYTSNDVNYLIAYIGDDLELLLPDSYQQENYEIYRYAFCYNDRITSVALSNGVTSIGLCAFEHCESLKSVVISESVTEIAYGVFNYCYSFESVYITDISKWCNILFMDNYSPLASAEYLYLNGKLVTELVIPDGVTEISANAFLGCEKIISVSIPNSVKYIGERAFMNCTSLTEVVIPDKVSRIEKETFYNCESLIYVYVPDGVTYIGDSAFERCYLLKNLNIPNSVNKIGSYAFRYCYDLENISIGNGLTSIGYNAFEKCNNLTNVYISSIEKWCNIGFADSYSNPLAYEGRLYLNGDWVTNLIIPEGVTTINKSAFYNCRDLISVVIPESVTSIENFAFSSCTKLVEVINHSDLDIVAGSSANGCVAKYAIEVHNENSKIVNIEDYLFYTYNSINYLVGYIGTDSNLLLPNSYNVKDYEIRRYAFYHCDDITSIIIPTSVTNIGDYAFYRCSAIDDVYYTGTEEEWNAINIGTSNVAITNATIHYNYVPETE